jgi:hypothetical protein
LKQSLLIISLIFCFDVLLAQPADTMFRIADTQLLEGIKPEKSPLNKLLDENIYLNSRTKAISLAVKPKKRSNNESLFYVLASLIFYFGLIKVIYSKYFSNLFRVFFNNTLRQSQLTDQLYSSKLASLFFNLLFFLSAGIYGYLLLQRGVYAHENINWYLLGVIMAVLLSIYVTKNLTLKFVGWLTGFKEEANTYLFVVFLINKILGICLLPVIVMISFSVIPVVNIVFFISFLFIGIMLPLRIIRTYSLLHQKLKLSPLHFILYLISLEILPIVLICKFVKVFLGKNQ